MSTRLGRDQVPVPAPLCLGLAVGALLTGVLGAQTSNLAERPTFRTQSNLVVVPFQVQRGSRSVELQASDVVLLEDGVPRAFSLFQLPQEHPRVDISVMFDVTPAENGRAGFWDAKSLQELTSYWSEKATRRLLDEHGATVRFSIYRFEQYRVERLCRSTSDPRVIANALRWLARPAPAHEAEDIPLPSGLTDRDRARRWVTTQRRPAQSWSLAGALAVLRDLPRSPASDVDQELTGRVLVLFSTGAEGTAITPQDLGQEALTAGVPVYPVALARNPPIWVLPYDGYQWDFGINDEPDRRPGKSMWGPAGPYFGIWPSDRLAPRDVVLPPYLNYPFELLGDLTGGRHFEAVNHSPLDDFGRPVHMFDDRSMTGGEVNDILDRVKRHALARFRSTYTVGFVPSPSVARGEHTLEVRLAPKSAGKIVDGKREATY